MTDIKDFIPVLSENANTIRARLEADVNAGLDPTDPSFLDTTPGGFWYDITQPVVLEIERAYDIIGTDLPASMLPQYAWGTLLDEQGLVVGLDRKDASFATGTVTFTGTNGTLIATGTVVAVPTTDPNADPVTFETTAAGVVAAGTLDLPVQAASAGAIGNVAVGQISLLLSSVAAPDGSPGVSVVSNALATSGGADIETDDKFSERILLEWQAAHGGGTIADIQSYALEYPGVGFARVIPVAQGPGTTAVIVTDDNNEPLGDDVVQGLWEQLDPPAVTSALTSNASLPTGTIHCDTTSFDAPDGRVRIGNDVVSYTGVTGSTLTGCTGGTGSYTTGEPVYQVGRGNGQAPIGMIVVVYSPSSTPIAVVLDVTFQSGFSSDGAGGTVDIGADIIASVQAYLDTLKPGDDVIFNRVIAQVLSIPGVLDVDASTTTINDGSGAVSENIAVDDNHVASAGDITFA